MLYMYDLFWGIYWKHQRSLLVINQMGDKSYVGVTWRVLQSLFDWISSFSLIVLRVNKLKLFFFLCCVIFCQYKKTVVKCRKLLFSSRKSGSSLNSPRLMTIFFVLILPYSCLLSGIKKKSVLPIELLFIQTCSHERHVMKELSQESLK